MENMLTNKIFSASESSLEDISLNFFRYQAKENLVYKKYIDILKRNTDKVNRIDQIPFLPISFFKTHQVYTGVYEPEMFFSSSGTSGTETSKHYVNSVKLYEKSFMLGFKHFYGNPKDYCILALLPSYLERQGSSLVYMADRLIQESQHPKSGFFLHNHTDLIQLIRELDSNGQPIILLGVTFALLDLAKTYRLKLENTIVMETGGMKGKGKELVRSEVHEILSNAFGVKKIHSEYGMTELLSQAYSKGDGIFKCPPWMKVLARDPYDPFTILPPGKPGALNVIDLANLYSCSFIQTDDLGAVFADGSFSVQGRMDGSQIRGCNLLV